MIKVRTALGTLCKNGHEHADSGMSLRVLRSNGTMSDCVVCRREDRKARYAATRDESRAAARAWYASHREEARARNARLYQENRASLLAYQARYRAMNPDLLVKKKREYYEANSDRLKAKSREQYYDDHEGELKKRQAWRDAHRDEVRSQARAHAHTPKRQEHSRKASAAYRARKCRVMGKVTQEYKDKLLTLFDGHCPICAVSMVVTSRLTPASRTWDHIVPLSMGGIDEDANLLPMCLSCNSTKGKKTIVGWLGFQRAKEVLDVVDCAA